MVLKDRLPIPPLSALGLEEFGDFEKQRIRGITYLDTYFIDTLLSKTESVHFHELVHVIQWRVLGPKDFLLLYATGVSEYGYLESPLEAMVYNHQRRFDARAALPSRGANWREDLGSEGRCN